MIVLAALQNSQGSDLEGFLKIIQRTADWLSVLTSGAQSISVVGDSCVITVDENAAHRLEGLAGFFVDAEKSRAAPLSGCLDYYKGVALDSVLVLLPETGAKNENTIRLRFLFSSTRGYYLPQERSLIVDNWLAGRIQEAYYRKAIEGKSPVKAVFRSTRATGFETVGLPQVSKNANSKISDAIITGEPPSVLNRTAGTPGSIVSSRNPVQRETPVQPETFFLSPTPGADGKRVYGAAAAPAAIAAQEGYHAAPEGQMPVFNEGQSEGFGERYGPHQTGPPHADAPPPQYQ
jgi:hypothetical protein